MYLAAGDISNTTILSIVYIVILVCFIALVVFVFWGLKRFFTRTIKSAVKEAYKEMNEDKQK